MAGDWIKMRGNLWDDPRVARLCDLTDAGEAAVIGGLYWLWSSADQHSEDGVMRWLTLRSIDRKTGIKGFGDALVSIGWLSEETDGSRIVRFEEHNGSSAKRRAAEAQRKANARSASASGADNMRTECGLDAELEKEKEKEKEKDKNNPPDGGLVPGKQPETPHQDIIAAYHELLPACPTVRQWTDARRKHLQQRWRENPERQSLEWWRKFFSYVSRSDFLTGKMPGRNNGPPFVTDLEWLIKPSNFTKVIEGRYHQNGTATTQR